ncbi:MAG: hypothetical protein EZS28_035489 [Streblomastix strix]|uniref:Uncharacterized protein n=1 Tax=Streblomastix strix TaxID=222440 RepID=A0A5J4UFN5_9EUKA|nr:MAG: hypothetical protein EZS28_035489 [Streblomastix strix]
MQSSSTDKQGPDKEPMTHNEAAEQILTLARIHAELQDPEQTKAQLVHVRFGEDDLDLRTNGTKSLHRIVIKNLLVDGFRKNLLAASQSLISKLDKKRACNRLLRQLWTLRSNWNLTHSSQTQFISRITLNKRSFGELLTVNSKRFNEKIQEGDYQNNAGANQRGPGRRYEQMKVVQSHGQTRDQSGGHEIQVGWKRDFNQNIAGENQHRDGLAIPRCNDSALSITINSSNSIYENTGIETECARVQLREGINLTYQFRVVMGNNVLFANTITEDTMKRIERDTEQKNLEYQAAAMAMLQGTLFLQQLYNPNPIPYIEPPYPNNQAQLYYNQQPGDSQGEGENFLAFDEEDAVVDVDDSKPTFKRARMHSQIFQVIHELKRKSYKAHLNHRANSERRKWRMIMISWGEAYKGPIKNLK